MLYFFSSFSFCSISLLLAFSVFSFFKSSAVIISLLPRASASAFGIHAQKKGARNKEIRFNFCIWAPVSTIFHEASGTSSLFNDVKISFNSSYLCSGLSGTDCVWTVVSGEFQVCSWVAAWTVSCLWAADVVCSADVLCCCWLIVWSTEAAGISCLVHSATLVASSVHWTVVWRTDCGAATLWTVAGPWSSCITILLSITLYLCCSGTASGVTEIFIWLLFVRLITTTQLLFSNFISTLCSSNTCLWRLAISSFDCWASISKSFFRTASKATSACSALSWALSWFFSSSCSNFTPHNSTLVLPSGLFPGILSNQVDIKFLVTIILENRKKVKKSTNFNPYSLWKRKTRHSCLVPL